MKFDGHKKVSDDNFFKTILKSNPYIHKYLLLARYTMLKKRVAQKRKGNILMLHQGRSGSTVLADLLSQHSAIHWDGEMYIDSNQIYAYFAKGPLHFLRVKMNQHSDLYYGFEIKAMENQQLKNHIQLPLDTFLDELQEIGFNFFINIHRKNYLRQHLSLLNLKQHNIRHTNQIINKPEKIFVDVKNTVISNHAAPMVANFRIVDAHYKNLDFKLKNRRTLKITYEDDILPDPLIAYRKICAFLDLQDESPAVRLRRTNPFRLQEMISNYTEVSNVLKNTEFEWMLDET